MPLISLLFLEQACENQEKCKEVASDLTEELDQFLTIEGKLEFLREREESRRAVERMLEVIAEAASYISNQTSTSIFCSYPFSELVCGDLIVSQRT